MPTENWIPVIEYEGLYEVSNLGNARSIRKGTASLLKFKNDKDGYRVLNLSKMGVVKTRKVHRIVAKAFIPNPQNKKFINHKNGVKNNNNVENLEWCTPSENSIHSAIVLGFKGISGSANPRSKKVRCDTIDVTFGSIREAGRMLGIGMSNIRDVCAGTCRHALGFVFRYID